GITFLVVSSIINGYPRVHELVHNLSVGVLDIFDENLLMLLGGTGGFIAGAYVEAAMVFNLYALAEIIEESVKKKAQEGLRSILTDIPDSAMLIKEQQLVAVEVEQLKAGDHIRFTAGDTVPVDVVLLSPALVDESVITGESAPVNHEPGDMVLSGSKLLTPCDAEVLRPLQESNLAQVQKTIAQTLSRKSAFRSWMERFTNVYSPLVLISAVAVFLFGLLSGNAFSVAVYRSSVLLLIACPCSLLLASPSAVSAAVSTLARQGVLVRNTDALEKLPQVGTVIFDKTGTITTGRMKITEAQISDEHLALVASVESYFKHPVADAIVAYAAEKNIVLKEAKVRQNGNVITGEIENHQVELTMKDLLQVKVDGMDVGFFKVEEELRDEAPWVIQRLKDQGYKIIILSGDQHEKVETLARQLKVDEYYANMTPEGKQAFVKELEKREHCLMVGDGLNDALALSEAHVSVALPDRRIKTIVETADFILSGTLTPLVNLPSYAQSYTSTVKTNVGLSLGIKVAIFTTSLLGYVALPLAVVADEGTALLVLLNSLRLTSRASH
ncbi:MAG: heavy metal translocating P-type ATPase, partial [Coprothermobacter proteolyticus]